MSHRRLFCFFLNFFIAVGTTRYVELDGNMIRCDYSHVELAGNMIRCDYSHETPFLLHRDNRKTL